MENESINKQENKRRRSDMSSVGTDCETSPKRINDQKSPLTHSVGTPDDSADANTVNNNSNRDITENGSAKTQAFGQHGNVGLPYYPPAPIHIQQREGMLHYPTFPASPPGFPICAFPPSPPIDPQIVSTAPPWAQLLVRQVGDIKIRMQKLDQIEHAVFDTRNALKHVNQSVSDLTNRVNQLENKTKTVEDCSSNQKVFEKALSKIKNSTKSQTDSIAKLQKDFELLKTENSKLERDNVKLQDELLNIKCNAMKDNLLFYNIKETESENCLKVIQNFCKDNLRIREPEQIQIESVYRVGKANEGNRRPMLVKFKSFHDREIVRKSSHYLKDTDYSISEQLPREYRERRKLLLPQYKRAKENNQKARFVKDKLYVNGKQVIPCDEDSDESQ